MLPLLVLYRKDQQVMTTKTVKVVFINRNQIMVAVIRNKEMVQNRTLKIKAFLQEETT